MKPKDIIIGLYLPNDLQDYLAFNFVRFWTEQNKTENILQKTRNQEKPLFRFASLLKGAINIVSIRWLYGHSALCSFIRYYIYDNYLELMRGVFLRINKGKRVLIQYGQNTTLLQYREQYYKNMDISRPEILKAVNETKKIFDELLIKAKDAGIKIHILFIPSKEAVFYRYAKEDGGYTMPENIARLAEVEEALVRDFSSFFSSRHVRTS